MLSQALSEVPAILRNVGGAVVTNALGMVRDAADAHRRTAASGHTIQPLVAYAAWASLLNFIIA